MRDLLFIAFFIVISVFSIRKPFISVSVWLWSGIFVPVYWLYGFAEGIRYNFIFGCITAIAYLISRNKPTVRFDFLFFLVVLFFIHTTLTTSFSVIDSGLEWFGWENFFKVTLMFIMINLIIRKQHHFEMLIWSIILSVGFYAFVEGLKFILSLGGHKIAGPIGHLIADNNHLALAILMTIPLTIYLISVTNIKLIKTGLIILVAIGILAILGTKSRGGFIGLVAVGSYFWFKSNRKAVSAVAIMVTSIIALSLLSDSWFDRMASIKSANDSGSFTTRIVSWKINTLMAMERPVLGGGFYATQHGFVWQSLALDFDKLNFISTPEPGNKGWAAHSIYFQVLGDHGFIGFTLFLLIISLSFIKVLSIERAFKDSWQGDLAKMIKLSLIAYCISGAALSMAYFELFYVLLSMIICLAAGKNKMTPPRLG